MHCSGILHHAFACASYGVWQSAEVSPRASHSGPEMTSGCDECFTLNESPADCGEQQELVHALADLESDGSSV